MTAGEIETSSIPPFDIQSLSDRHQIMFGSIQRASIAHMVTPDEEWTVGVVPHYGTVHVTPSDEDHLSPINAVWQRSGYQIPVKVNLHGGIYGCNMNCRPIDAFFDFEKLRREAVSETISSLQSEAENEQTRNRLSRETFWALFKHRALSGWNAIFEKLESFSKLRTGWDGYSARAPEKAAILSAKLFLSQLTESGRVPDRIKPSVVGGIGITFRSNQRKCYVEFYNNGTVYALFSDGQTEPETCQVPPTAQNYKVLIKAIQGYLNAGNP
jgi:hypothetical protein